MEPKFLVPQSSRRIKTKEPPLQDAPQTAPRLFDENLAAIIEAWSKMPDEVQAALAAIVKANRSP